MDYKEKVIALLNSQELSKEQKEKLEDIFPELKESEDEKMRKAILKWLSNFNAYDKIFDSFEYKKINIIEWLEKQGEQKPAWSEEDRVELIRACVFIKNTKLVGVDKEIESAISWLESLKDRCLPQPKQEWSDEDERCVRNILWRLDGNILGPEYMDRCKRWLESIKDRIIPQKQWKPTKEQIKTLDDAIIYINATDNFSGSLDVLKNILEQLKKLK